MARESNLSIVCKLIAQALVDGKAHVDLSSMLAAYFPSASCIRVAGPVTDDLLVLSSSLIFPKSLDLELSLIPCENSAAGEAYASGQCSFYSYGSAAKHDLRQLWKDKPESIAALCIAIPKPGHTVGGMNTQCLGAVLMGIKRGDNSAVSGNLTALAYVLSSRFASAFSKVAAHMRAYYLLVDPAEEAEELAAARSAGEASYSSGDASSSDSSADADACGEGQPVRAAGTTALHERPGRPPAQPNSLPDPLSPHAEVHRQRAGHVQPPGEPVTPSDTPAAPGDRTAGEEPGSSAAPAQGGATGVSDATAGGLHGSGAAASGALADPGTASEPRQKPPDEPCSSGRGTEQQERGGKGEGKGGGGRAARQHPFWLTFKHGGLEQAFIGWQATQQAKGDLVGGFLAFFVELAAMKDPMVKKGVMASGRPFVATLSLFCILNVMLFRPHWWRYRREAYISALLIAMAVQSAAAFTPCVAVRLPPSKLSDPIWFARLIYAEAMAVMPIMFVVRSWRLAVNHMVLLLLAVGRSLPFVCSTPGAMQPFRTCFAWGLLLLVCVGCLLPMSALWAFEVHARRTFLRSPAAEAAVSKQD